MVSFVVNSDYHYNEKQVSNYISSDIPSEWEKVPEMGIYSKEEQPSHCMYIRRRDGAQIIISITDKSKYSQKLTLCVSLCGIKHFNKDITSGYLESITEETFKIFFGDRKFKSVAPSPLSDLCEVPHKAFIATID